MCVFISRDSPVKKVKKGKDVDLYSEFHAPGTPNALTSLKLDRQTASYDPLQNF